MDMPGENNTANTLMSLMSSVRSYATRAPSPQPRVTEADAEVEVEVGAGAGGNIEMAAEVPAGPVVSDLQAEARISTGEEKALIAHAPHMYTPQPQHIIQEQALSPLIVQLAAPPPASLQLQYRRHREETVVQFLETTTVLQDQAVCLCHVPGPSSLCCCSPAVLQITASEKMVQVVPTPTPALQIAPSGQLQVLVQNVPVPEFETVPRIIELADQTATAIGPGCGRTPPPPPLPHPRRPAGEYEYDFYGRSRAGPGPGPRARDYDDRGSSAFMGEESDGGGDGDDEKEEEEEEEEEEEIGFSKGVRGRGLRAGDGAGARMRVSAAERMGPYDPLEGHVLIISLISSSSSSSSSSTPSPPPAPSLLPLPPTLIRNPRKRPPPTPTPPRSPTPAPSPLISSSSSSSSSSSLQMFMPKRRCGPMRQGPWNSTDRMLLVESLQAGVDFEALAEVMGRAPRDVFERFSDVVAAGLYLGCVERRDWGMQTEEGRGSSG